MKMNNLSGLLKSAKANIIIATQVLDVKNLYGAGESFNELESIKLSLMTHKFVIETSGGTIVEGFAIDDMMTQIENTQSKLESMIDQLGEDYDYKNFNLEGE